MEFKAGDLVEHSNRGKGTFIEYGMTTFESVVEFNEDSDAQGDTLTVSTALLKKIEKPVK